MFRSSRWIEVGNIRFPFKRKTCANVVRCMMRPYFRSKWRMRFSIRGQVEDQWSWRYCVMWRSGFWRSSPFLWARRRRNEVLFVGSWLFGRSFSWIIRVKGFWRILLFLISILQRCSFIIFIEERTCSYEERL